MRQSQIQRLWYGLGLLQSNRCSYWSSGELESGPGAHSFLLLPGHQYWGSLTFTETQQSQRWNTVFHSFDLKLKPSRASEQTDTVSPQVQICLCSLPLCPNYFSQLLVIASKQQSPSKSDQVPAHQIWMLSLQWWVHNIRNAKINKYLTCVYFFKQM